MIKTFFRKSPLLPQSAEKQEKIKLQISQTPSDKFFSPKLPNVLDSHDLQKRRKGKKEQMTKGTKLFQEDPEVNNVILSSQAPKSKTGNVEKNKGVATSQRRSKRNRKVVSKFGDEASESEENENQYVQMDLGSWDESDPYRLLLLPCNDKGLTLYISRV